MDAVTTEASPDTLLTTAEIRGEEREPLVKTLQSLSELKESINRFKPVVEEVVDALGRRNYLYKKAPEGVLKSDCVCSYASYALGHLLNAEGKVDIRLVEAQLKGPAPYPINDHKFLLAKLSDEDVVIDAAYYQYIRLLGLKPEQMPKDDILVFPLSELDTVISSFVELRDLNREQRLFIGYHHREEIYYTDVYLSPEDLANYFRAIWSLTPSHKVSEAGSFAEGVSKYNQEKLDRNYSAEPHVLDKLKEASLI